jgi:hypothetical protein
MMQHALQYIQHKGDVLGGHLPAVHAHTHVSKGLCEM